MRSVIDLLLRFSIFAVLLVAAGCGGGAKLGDVTGAVTIDGAPVDKGSIAFFPVDGQGPSTGGEIVAGKYESQAPIGACKVEIRVSKIVGQKKLYDTPESPVQNILEEVLPPKYNESSELRLEVQAGKNEKNWELTVK